MKYRRKIEVIEAMQFYREKWGELNWFAFGRISPLTIVSGINGRAYCTLLTSSGKNVLVEGDYVLKNSDCQLSSMDKTTFEKIYEEFIDDKNTSK
jgi:hypothetical protein